ncbi:DUF6734 family protein [Pontibacter russatus]|uniref:DUF6734 family protein n=1 Tax=Pontibacter russatus TaxID=2694929 RepID=UPI00137AE26F|nr:DUF6734 family protein [Pontibacter russatus]
MRFIQTLHIDKIKDPFSHSFGWAAPEYHLMSWTLCSLQLQKIYKKIDLYANSSAAKLLIDTLELPYDNVYITHDNLTLSNENLWALPKIYTYSLQHAPFLHIDGDIFLFNQFDESLLKGELIAQNIEEATDYYLSTQRELIKHFTYFPSCVKADFSKTAPISAVNAGILGGNNIGFINEYSRLAFKYINKNINNLSFINVNRFNVFFEQHLFYSLAKQRNLPINVLFPIKIKDNEYKHLCDFHETPCKKQYLHLLGQSKKDEYTCIQMALKLRDLYPEHYYKIMSIFKRKESRLFLELYDRANLNTLEDYLKFNNKAEKIFNKGKSEIDTKSRANYGMSYYSGAFDLSISQAVARKNINKIDNPLIKEKAYIDYEVFIKHLIKYLDNCRKINLYYLYGRDIKSARWYCELFSNDENYQDKIISKCKHIEIIESEFDWAGIINKNKRMGVKYYENIKLSPGIFYNLIIPEVHHNKVSFFDLDELEKLILDNLSVPLSIERLIHKMKYYTDENVLQNHMHIYSKLIVTLIKQLVIKKAIRPS